MKPSQSFRIGRSRTSLRLVFHDRVRDAGAVAPISALGREEDPAFTIKTMIIQANWPAPVGQDVTKQVTDRIEKKLEELESLDYTKSVTTAGQTIIFVNLWRRTKARDVSTPTRGCATWSPTSRAIFPQGVGAVLQRPNSATSTAISTPSPRTA